MWIVMTSSASMPSSCKGNYRRVAVVSINQEYTAKGLVPKMISMHAKGIYKPGNARQAIIDLGNHNVGKTERCAYRVALADAERRAYVLNNTASDAWPGDLWTWGGSA